MFIGIKPEEKEAIPGLHSPEYQFDDTVLAGAAAALPILRFTAVWGN